MEYVFIFWRPGQHGVLTQIGARSKAAKLVAKMFKPDKRYCQAGKVPACPQYHLAGTGSRFLRVPRQELREGLIEAAHGEIEI